MWVTFTHEFTPPLNCTKIWIDMKCVMNQTSYSWNYVLTNSKILIMIKHYNFMNWNNFTLFQAEIYCYVLCWINKLNECFNAVWELTDNICHLSFYSCRTEERPGQVSYDVFKPDAKFRKSNPGVPDHRVCVVRYTERERDVNASAFLFQTTSLLSPPWRLFYNKHNKACSISWTMQFGAITDFKIKRGMKIVHCIN